MNNLFKYVCQELQYMFKSKTVLLILVILLAVTIGISFVECEYVREMYENYSGIEEFYINNGDEEEMQKDLNGEYTVTEGDEGTTTVQNPILFYYHELHNAVYSISPQYIVTQAFEISLLFLPLLSFVFGSSIYVKDYKYRLLKHKILRFGRMNYILGKIITILLVIVFSVLCFSIMNGVSGIIINNLLSDEIPLEKFNDVKIIQSSNLFIRTLIICLISTIYCVYGALCGVIFKNSVPGIILAVMYLYVVPLNFKYEPQNMIYTIVDKHFDFIGLAEISTKKSCEYGIAMLILVMTVIVSLVLISVIINRRSSYN